MPHFVRITDENGQDTLLNIDRVVCIDEIYPGHCCLDFGSGIRLCIEGKGADGLMESLGQVPNFRGGVTFVEPEMPEPVKMPPIEIPRFPGAL